MDDVFYYLRTKKAFYVKKICSVKQRDLELLQNHIITCVVIIVKTFQDQSVSIKKEII